MKVYCRLSNWPEGTKSFQGVQSFAGKNAQGEKIEYVGEPVLL